MTVGPAERAGPSVVLCPQPHGVRDRAFRDPVGHLIRIQEKRRACPWPTVHQVTDRRPLP